MSFRKADIVKSKRVAINLVVVVVLALSLAACRNNSTMPTTPGVPAIPGDPDFPTPGNPQPKEISGKVEGWTLGEAFIRAEGHTERDETIVLAEGPISADGSFRFTLPVSGENLDKALYSVDSEDFCGPNSSGAVEVTPSQFNLVDVNFFSVYESADSSLDEAIGELYLTSGDPSVYSGRLTYEYSFTAASVQGECVQNSTDTGGSDSSTTRFDLDYKPGWNEVQYTSAGFDDEPVVNLYVTAPFPADTSWAYAHYDPPETEPAAFRMKRSPAAPF